MQLVQIHKDEPVTTTLIIADGMKIKHRAIMELVNKYKSELKEFGLFTVETLKIDRTKKGRPVKFAWVNEGQATFLVTLMKNSEIVVSFKKTLSLEFIKQRKILAQLLSQKQNQEWIENREQGKIARKESTDTMQRFVEYAKSQGSEHSEKYYVHFTKMENKALFVVEQKFPNLRDVLNGQQLNILQTADIAVAKAIQDGMDKKLHYTDIYQLAKERILAFTEIVGKSLVPIMRVGLDTQKSLELQRDENALQETVF